MPQRNPNIARFMEGRGGVLIWNSRKPEEDQMGEWTLHVGVFQRLTDLNRAAGTAALPRIRVICAIRGRLGRVEC